MVIMEKILLKLQQNIKQEFGDRFANVSEKEAIAYFRKIGTEHELQKIKDILKEFRVVMMFGLVKHLYMMKIRLNQQFKD